MRNYEKRETLRGEDLSKAGPVVVEIEGLDSGYRVYFTGARKILFPNHFWMRKAQQLWGCHFTDHDLDAWVGGKLRLSGKPIKTKAGTSAVVVEVEILTPPPTKTPPAQPEPAMVGGADTDELPF